MAEIDTFFSGVILAIVTGYVFWALQRPRLFGEFGWAPFVVVFLAAVASLIYNFGVNSAAATLGDLHLSADDAQRVRAAIEMEKIPFLTIRIFVGLFGWFTFVQVLYHSQKRLKADNNHHE
jgi:hypothetical protein